MSSESEKDALTVENQHLKDEVERLKSPFIDSLVTDSKGYFSRDPLEKLSIDNLKILRRTFDSTVARDYQAFLAEREQKQKAAKPSLGTVGSYNQDTGKFENGV
jgi:hypothetical protein